MGVNELTTHDLAIIFWVIAGITPILVTVLIWTINRYLKRDEVKDDRIDRFTEITTKTLTELKIITQVHEVEIEGIKEDIRSAFMIKYTKEK